MDPIQTIGKLLKGAEQRDAIHIAILPVVAGEELYRGQEITLAFGTENVAIAARDYGMQKSLGIVDPFFAPSNSMSRYIQKDQWFWMFMHPATITGLRHQWHHPMVDNRPKAKSDSEKWLHGFAEEWGFDYDEMIAVATDPSATGYDYITAHGMDLHSRGELGEAHEQFWQHLALLTGRVFDTAHQLKVQWSCSC